MRRRRARRAQLRRLQRLLADLRHDLRYAGRQLRRSPGFAVLVVATLAIGIGANATMVGTIDHLLLRPPPNVRAPEDIVRLLVTRRNPLGGANVGQWLNYPTYLDMQRAAPAFAGVAAYTAATLPFGVGAEAVPVHAWLVSATFFHVLGVGPTLGRLFKPADGFPTGETAGGPPLAVLGYGFWQRQFAGSPTALGRVVHVGRATYTVVGVAPPNFRGTEPDAPDVYVPITVAAPVDEPALWFANRGATWLSLIARVKPGVAHDVAAQQASALWLAGNAYPGMDSTARIVAAPIIPGRGPDAPREVRIALWLGAVSLIVLLIASANVANLLLGRAFARRRETAVRLALGAGRARLARQLVTEGLVLAALGAAGAVWLAALGGRLLQHLFAAGPGRDGFIDVRVLVFTMAVGLGTGVLVSLASVLQGTAPDLTRGLRMGGGARGGRSDRTRILLLGTQAALCLVLLVGASVFVQSMRHVDQLDLGMDIAHTTEVRFDLNELGLPHAAAAASLARIAANVRAIPGVEGVAFADYDPYRGGRAVAAQTRERGETDAMRRAWAVGSPMEAAVDSGFFRTVGASSLRGRDFNSGDRRGAQRVAIVNAPLAKLLWPDEDPLGRCMLLPHWQEPLSDQCVMVVGVLAGFWRRNILNRGVLAVYVPLAQSTGLTGWPRALFVRVQSQSATRRDAISRAVRRARPELRAIRVMTMQDVLDPQLQPWRLGAVMFALFGAVALAIAVVGLYGVVAFNAAQRSSEIAIRVALGAGRRHVLVAVGGAGLRAVGGGLAVGIALVLAAHHWIDPLLFRASASDPTIIAASAAVLMLVSVVGTIVPTARALLKNPADALRAE